MTQYALANPIPDIVNVGAVSQGVDVIGGRVMWKDGSNVKHLLASFGGEQSEEWHAHYCNLGTNESTLISPGTDGAIWKAAYHSVQDKLYFGTNYTPNSFAEFDPNAVPPAVTYSTVMPATVNVVIIGDDGLVYMFCYASNAYSFDPVGRTLKNYGEPSGGASLSTLNTMGAPSGYIYCGVKYSTGKWGLYHCPTTGNIVWTPWEFNEAGDTYLVIYLNTLGEWICRRTLADTSNKYYILSGGTYTETSDPAHLINANAGHIGGGPSYCEIAGTEDEYPWFNSAYQIDVDFTDLFPIKSIHEYSQFKYKLHSVGEWTETVALLFTENWTALAAHDLIPRVNRTAFFLSGGYNAAVNLAYNGGATPTYLGAQIIGTYAVIKAPSGLIYYCGYANRFAVYNPELPWTLTNANATPVGPGDGDAWTNRPNPFLLKLAVTPQLHYRTCLDYDANGLIWQGGTTTRVTPADYGNVMWYDPSDHSAGYVFDDWATQEPTPGKFGDLCAALSRSKICVSDQLGNIWIVDAATKAVDPVPIVPVEGETGRTYMVEVSNDLVLGVYVGSVNKIFTFKPSTKALVSGPGDLPAGAPFGWTDGSYNRLEYKLELGPDNYGWMYVGNTLYRINPATLVFSSIDATGGYAKIKFVNGNRDLLWYGYNTTVKYYPDIFSRIDNRMVSGVVANEVGGVVARRVAGVLQ